MAPLGWQPCGLRRHCHSSASRRALRCKAAPSLELAFPFTSAPGYHPKGHLFYLTEREQRILLPFTRVWWGQLRIPQDFFGPRKPAMRVFPVHYERFFPRTVIKRCVVYLYFLLTQNLFFKRWLLVLTLGNSAVLKIIFKGKGAGLLLCETFLIFKESDLLLVSTFSADSEPLKSFLNSDFECTVLWFSGS